MSFSRAGLGPLGLGPKCFAPAGLPGGLVFLPRVFPPVGWVGGIWFLCDRGGGRCFGCGGPVFGAAG